MRYANVNQLATSETWIVKTEAKNELVKNNLGHFIPNHIHTMALTCNTLPNTPGELAR